MIFQLQNLVKNIELLKNQIQLKYPLIVIKKPLILIHQTNYKNQF